MTPLRPDPGLAPSDASAWRAATRSASALAASVWACAASRSEMPLCAARSRSPAATRRLLAAGTAASTLAGASFPSGEDEHAGMNVSAKTAIAALPSIGCARQISTVPPTAAQGLEQGRGVGEAVGFGLNQAEPRLLIRLGGVQHGKIGCIAVLMLKF